MIMIIVWVHGRKTIICADDSKEIRKWKKKYFITQICIYLTLTYIESPIYFAKHWLRDVNIVGDSWKTTLSSVTMDHSVSLKDSK